MKTGGGEMRRNMEPNGGSVLQRRLLSCCVPGDVLRGIVGAVDRYGIYIDVGGGAEAILPRRRIAISPLCGPERFETGAVVYGAVHKIDREKKRIELTHRELLGTFAEVTEGLSKGDLLRGIWCGDRRVELAPNLLALVRGGAGRPGTPAEVKITGIDHARCRVYTEIAGVPETFEPPHFTYYITSGRIKHWSYTGSGKKKPRAETRFCR